MDHIASLRIKPKQSLGQNFLTDQNIARNIIRELQLSKEDLIVEIGPGKGALTKHLVDRAKHVIAVEVDGRVIPELEKNFASSADIVHQDFLEADLAGWRRKYRHKLRIVGNIPYHLTSSILFKIFRERSFVHDLTIMVQREVAQRIVAKPGTKLYGILSVFSQLYGTPRILFTVSPNCFYPQPKVISAVLRMEMKEKLAFDFNEETFANVVKTAFGKRRKTLRNSLAYLPYDETTVDLILSRLAFSMSKRPEQLTVKEFVHLAGEIDGILSNNNVMRRPKAS